MEGAHFLATGKLVSLSEQNLVDCSHNGNMGCMGGMMDRAFTWTETHPLETEADYPYQGWTISGCHYDTAKG
jgi:cathepsin L